jgi:hypothetical protein
MRVFAPSKCFLSVTARGLASQRYYLAPSITWLRAPTLELSAEPGLAMAGREAFGAGQRARATAVALLSFV